MKRIVLWCKNHPRAMKAIGAAFVAAMGALGYNLPTWWPEAARALGMGQ